MFAINRSQGSKLAGIALHWDSVRYVELDGERDSLKIVKQETVSITPGAIEKNSIVAADAVVSAFENLKSAVGGFKCPIVLGIPSNDTIVRPIEYPKMSLADIKEALPLEFDLYFPYSYKEAAYDVSEVETPNTTAYTSVVIVAACRRSIVNGIVEGASRAGMRVAAVEPMNVAFFRAATGPDVCTGSYLVILVEPESTQIMLGYKDNGILFRSTAADLTSNEARESDEGILPILRDVQNAIIFAGNVYEGFTLNHLILGGIVDKNSRLGELFESTASLTVEPLNVWELWNTLPPAGNAEGFETAFGLAARNFTAKTQFDIRTAEMKKEAAEKPPSTPMSTRPAVVKPTGPTASGNEKIK